MGLRSILANSRAAILFTNWARIIGFYRSALYFSSFDDGHIAYVRAPNLTHLPHTVLKIDYNK